MDTKKTFNMAGFTCKFFLIFLILAANLGLSPTFNIEGLNIKGVIAKADDTGLFESGIKDPVLSALMEREIIAPHTKQIVNGRLANLISANVEPALGAKSILQNEIVKVSNPHEDLRNALSNLSDKSKKGEISIDDAKEIKDILLGTTSGKIYDGFALLNFNRWNEDSIPDSAFPEDAVKGEYKTKKVRHSGITERNFKKPAEGANPDVLDEEDEVNIWEVDVNMIWYGQQFDSDTFFIHIPIVNSVTNVPSQDDTLRINYHIYSLIDEDFAPTQVLLDADPGVESKEGGSVRLPHKGEDTVWIPVEKNTVSHITVQHTAFRFLRGIYTWGWRLHPPRIHFLDFLFELKNAHNEKNELNPMSLSRAIRNRELDIAGIGDAAPEKKIYKVVRAALDGKVTAEELDAMLNDPATEPAGSHEDWMALMTNQIQLPPEVINTLNAEGKIIDDYDFIVAFLNNEMYGKGPYLNAIRNWKQGEVLNNRVFNLDNHSHYYRNVDFGRALNEDITRNVSGGVFSFEVMNFKPVYGAPKVAEMQWRTGWGFRPHYSIIQQDGVFIDELDKKFLKPFVAPKFSMRQMTGHYGYQFSDSNRGGDFIFNPPRYIIQSKKEPAFDYLYECNVDLTPQVMQTIEDKWKISKSGNSESYQKGLVIGQKTEGFGVAKMCNHPLHIGKFCDNDLSRFHPLNIKNVDKDFDGIKDALLFPTFLMNPNKNGGDIIPPTAAWEPFLYFSPFNGTIYIDPDEPEKGHWADLTYAHGKPVQALSDIEINVEMPRSKGQAFYQFDDLFHDNNIFSPHPLTP